MKYLLAILLLTACSSADFQPDRFDITYGTGDSETDGGLGWRPLSADTESSWVEFTLGWDLHDTADREERAATEHRYLDALYAIKPLPVQPLPVSEPVAPEPQPAPKHEQAKAEEKPSSLTTALLPYAGMLALALVALLNRLGRVGWLNHTPKTEESV